LQLVLTEAHQQLLSKEAKEKKPNESCALLFGKKENNKWIVNEVFIAENIDGSPVNFTISNEQLIQGYKMAEEKGLDVIGIFHSHPNSAPYPSSTDKKFMEINPVAWVIFSEITNNFKAYLFESEIKEIPILT
jgi:proteasome lid subunit RPN8/RPN11